MSCQPNTFSLARYLTFSYRLIYSTLNILTVPTSDQSSILLNALLYKDAHLIYYIHYVLPAAPSALYQLFALLNAFFFIQTSSTPCLLYKQFFSIASPDHLQLSSLFDIQTSCRSYYYTQDALAVAPSDHLQLSD